MPGEEVGAIVENGVLVEKAIADLYALFDDSAFVWYGMSSESGYPISGPCESFGNEVVPVDELPVEIEGVVTLHPRFFQKTSWCGEDERYYGSYTLEDETGGILVLKDSRIADFTYGDRVKLKVYGLLKYFDTYAVVTHTDEEVVSRGNDVYYEELPDDQELISDDVARTFRWTGEVAVEPSNSNFNEICMVEKGGDYTACDPRCVASDMCGGSWLVSIDRELGQRDPMPIHQGQILQVTGPVVNSFGLRFLVARLGQLQLIDE